MKELFEKYLNEEYKETEFKIEEIKENDKYAFCYLYSSENYDVPVLVYDKKTKEIKDEILPPFTDDSDAKTIFKEKKFNKFKK